MKKSLALKLKDKADEIAFNFSRTDRDRNFNNEQFFVKKILPLSESTAVVYLEKNTGKVGIAFCYWINMKGGMWQYFFPTYDHCVGAEKLREILHEIEVDNFSKNFEDA
tara:strand:- start:1498 stop:1824 length:327 start_codon:yes stop_codon:yes gene_type:complete